MSFTHWLNRFCFVFERGSRAKISASVLSPTVIEVLEERRLLSALTVMNNLDSGAGSLRAVVAAARSGDTIVFAPALLGSTISLTGGELLINRNLTIAGPTAGNLTVSGAYKSRVFEVAKGKSFTLGGLTIIDGGASQGGAIFNRGTLAVGVCTFSGNLAVGIYNATGTATVDGCTFADNTATVGGAAIVNDGPATLTLSNSTLKDNAVGSSGGAVNNSGTLNVINSNLSGNSAQYGGSIYNVGSMTISGSAISNNTASLNGAAIYGANSYFNSGTLNVIGCSLLNNTAGNYGGGICASAGTFAIANSTLNDNSAKYGGGISYFGGVVTLSASTLTGNTAFSRGGGIFVTNRLAYNGSVTVENSSMISGNLAPDGAGPDAFNNGGLYLDGSSTIGVLDGVPAVLI